MGESQSGADGSAPQRGDRRRIGSGYPHEASFGYSRAVRVGDTVHVSGTTAEGADLDGGAQVQTAAAIARISEVLVAAGSGLGDVVRTVVYARDLGQLDAIAAAHSAAFGSVRPANTLVEVTRLVPDRALVEIEATAIIARD